VKEKLPRVLQSLSDAVDDNGLLNDDVLSALGYKPGNPGDYDRLCVTVQRLNARLPQNDQLVIVAPGMSRKMFPVYMSRATSATIPPDLLS